MINLEQVAVFFPQGYLFKDISAQIVKGDKIGLAGKNGAGKSTLLKLIAGREQASEGKVHKQKGIQVGFLTQDIVLDSSQRVFNYLFHSNEQLNHQRTRIDEINEELVSRTDYESEAYLALLDELNEVNDQFALNEGFLWEEKISETLKGLGFEAAELDRPLNEFSGGWKMRAELARILVNNPDVILLDEPTNHLDIVSIAWLESYLQKFSGAVIVISHDRLFLDNVTRRTLEISQGKLNDYPYSYSKYKIKREEEQERLVSAKKQQDKEVKHTQELIDKFRAKKNKAAFAQSLIKKLERTEFIELEGDQTSSMRIRFPLSVQPGKWVLELEDVGKSFGDKKLFGGINITVGRGEKIALLGPNGVGKSTFLKRIMGTLEGDGEVHYGHNVGISYFAQDQAESLDRERTVLETVDEIAVGEIRKDLRKVLGAFLFSGEDVDKKVSVLSGGERTRLALCQLLLSPSNFLILDEPTNHLDIQSKEVLKQALKHYEGTFIIVSHDREFLEGLTNRIWDIQNQGLKIYHDGVQDYLKHKLSSVSPQKSSSSGKKAAVEQEAQKGKQKTSEPVLSYEEQKQLKREKNQLQNRVQKLEKKIDELETQLSDLEKRLSGLTYTEEEGESENAKLLNEYEAKKASLDQVMKEWEEQSVLLDEMNE
ncbi:MAG: ABC transporter ATP-binding protein [Bacteroidetes bacterium]|nr:MAG: ABC transporter ATP-binding protein [Bacteroidota bacterium]